LARWYENGAGGRYLPTSTVQHEVTIPVGLVADHPVTVGRKDFQIFDETYKGMGISDKAQVLGSTREKTADGPLVWVGPFAGSLLVFIQMGHGPEAHRDPNCRQLVRHAIAWAGGR
jgi:type 1 glutamine amidotransferase